MATTVGDLKRWLSAFSDDAKIVFEVAEYSPEGFPEWTECGMKPESLLDDDDNEMPTGRVSVTLFGDGRSDGA